MKRVMLRMKAMSDDETAAFTRSTGIATVFSSIERQIDDTCFVTLKGEPYAVDRIMSTYSQLTLSIISDEYCQQFTASERQSVLVGEYMATDIKPSVIDLATKYDVAPSTAYAMLKQSNVPLSYGSASSRARAEMLLSRDDLIKRDRDILIDYVNGMPRATIAAKYELTYARVTEIINGKSLVTRNMSEIPSTLCIDYREHMYDIASLSAAYGIPMTKLRVALLQQSQPCTNISIIYNLRKDVMELRTELAELKDKINGYEEK